MTCCRSILPIVSPPQDELGSPTWRLSDAFEREMLRLVGCGPRVRARWGALVCCRCARGCVIPSRYSARREGRLSLRDLTTSLGPALTSTTDARRADGTRLLSQTLARCPSAAVSSNELHFFAEFFASRLKDMACLEGVLRGLVALGARLRLSEATPPPGPPSVSFPWSCLRWMLSPPPQFGAGKGPTSRPCLLTTRGRWQSSS